MTKEDTTEVVVISKAVNISVKALEVVNPVAVFMSGYVHSAQADFPLDQQLADALPQSSFVSFVDQAGLKPNSGLTLCVSPPSLQLFLHTPSALVSFLLSPCQDTCLFLQGIPDEYDEADINRLFSGKP